MDPIILVSLIGIGFCLFLLMGAPLTWMRRAGTLLTRIVLGALALFLLNVFGGVVDYHLPINLFTVSVSGLLGFPGVLMLVAVDVFILM